MKFYMQALTDQYELDDGEREAVAAAVAAAPVGRAGWWRAPADTALANILADREARLEADREARRAALEEAREARKRAPIWGIKEVFGTHSWSGCRFEASAQEGLGTLTYEEAEAAVREYNLSHAREIRWNNQCLQEYMSW